MKKYKIIFLMFMAVFTATMAAATGYKLVSPNGRLVSEINVGDSLTFTLSDER